MNKVFVRSRSDFEELVRNIYEGTFIRSAFIEKIKDAKNWFLHCTAGISRSGTIGEFISDYLGQDYFQFKRDNPQTNPNSEIKKILYGTFKI